MSVWLCVDGNVIPMVEKPEFNDNGVPNTPAKVRAEKLKEALESKGYVVNGPYVEPVLDS